ncbi:MAG: DUF460 domain-containing protein [Desulfurococcales archaeon]|nr:DUF460 domain-containing protein [Desulfurococcales archaeon]
MERGRSPQTLYMGVDIESGSPQSSSRRALYSVVVIDGEGRTIASYQGVPLARLIRLAWYYKPRKIAFDNILELAPNRAALEKTLELFPPESEIVQVTITERGFQSVRELSAPYRDLVGQGKLRPGRTAYLLALLASRGMGAPVRTVEHKTKIVVTKARSPSGGGFSQQRYRRRVRASVLNAAMRVKDALDRAGLEYDFNYRKSEGGLERAVFIVYAPREKLLGVVRPHRGVDYVITVNPEYRVKLSLPGASEKPARPIIVGIDPGITTGLAVIDLYGNVLYLDSSKELDRRRAVEVISEFGRPLIIAVDVPIPPESVRKVAASLGASLYTPPEEMSVALKRELASKALRGRLPQDSHQRDALAAAYKAFLVWKSKLGHVESQLRRIGLEVDSSRVKEAVIRGLTVAEALEEAIQEKLDTIHAESPPTPPSNKLQNRGECPQGQDDRVYALEEEVRRLKKIIRELKNEKEELIARLEAEVAKARSEAYRSELVAKLEAELSVMQSELERIRDEMSSQREKLRTLEKLLVSLWRNDAVLAPRIPSLTVKNLRRAEEVLETLAGELVYVDTPSYEDSALSLLPRLEILAVVTPDVRAEMMEKALRRLYIPVLRVSKEKILWETPYYVLLPYVVLDRAMEAKRRLEEERTARIDIERMIVEYRKSRMGKV